MEEEVIQKPQRKWFLLSVLGGLILFVILYKLGEIIGIKDYDLWGTLMYFVFMIVLFIAIKIRWKHLPTSLVFLVGTIIVFLTSIPLKEIPGFTTLFDAVGFLLFLSSMFVLPIFGLWSLIEGIIFIKRESKTLGSTSFALGLLILIVGLFMAYWILFGGFSM
jgi:hypothetical protein